MGKTVDFNEKKKDQFNRMLIALTTIANQYYSTDGLLQNAESRYGLTYQEALEMSYENMRADALQAIKGVKAME